MMSRATDKIRQILRGTKSKEVITPTCVSITIKETLVFTGTVESIDINTDIEGSDATCKIKFNASDMLRQLRANING